ncbi:hypothetical protein LCGC14_2172710 [marine sediment metagenome]|uniref:Bacteriophage head to tail connecting protein n=1 Tax=marine sediment metagenome TaxID=412755 RepID=A0A0F9DPH0_9ZZZZ
MPENTEIIKRWGKLRSEKSQWDNHYDDLARIFLPRRLGFASTTIEGERRTEDLYDSTPMQAARGLANAIGGMMRPEGLPEVEMMTDEDALNNMDEVKDWLADSEKRMKDAFNNPKARFRQAGSEKDMDLVVFGTAVMFIGESISNLLFQSIHLKDATYFFNEEGSPEGMFRKRKFTLRQAVQRFGKNKLSLEAQKKFEKSEDDKIDILHAVLPRKESKSQPLFAKDLPFADLWIEIEEKNTLSEGGFHEFPFVVPRWDTTSGEDQGRSPGMVALPDGDTLQAMGETILIAGQRAADPPLAVPNDGSFSAINTFPGGLVYYDVDTASELRGSPFFPIESGMNLPISREMQGDTRDQVWSAFFRNILNLPVEGPQMTATEVIQRKEEFMREIGPTFGKFETEDTAPTVERVFMIMLRGGGFAPIPEVLQGQNIRFEYNSPVKRIRQQIDAAAARMWADEQIALGASIPEALDLINVDELGRFSAEAAGIPKQIVNSDEVVEQIRQGRAQVKAEKEETEALQQLSELVKTGADAGEKLTRNEQEVA